MLTREKWLGDRVAGELRQRGIDVSLASKGLLETPEARLAIACLRRLTDRRDSLASAEIVALENRRAPEEWITDRLEFLKNLADEDDAAGWAVKDSPALAALECERDEIRLWSPQEAFDEAVNRAGVARIIAAWGPSQARVTQRVANLERLRGFVQEYETRCGDFGIPATLNGLIGWLEQLSADELDRQGLNPETDAVHIGTCHAAKGREWPVVVVTDPGYGLKTRLYDLRVVATGECSSADPLAGRSLRFWINPFGRSRSSYHAFLENSDTGRAATASAHGEERRLLYVTLTRARDRMVWVHEEGQSADWLAEAGEAAARLVDDGELPAVAMQRNRYVLREDLEQASPAAEVLTPVRTATRTDRLPAIITPSAQSAAGAASVLNVHEFGMRLPLNKHPNERDLGDAIHRILAAEAVNPQAADREQKIADLLSAFDLAAHVDATDVRRMVDRYREFLRKNFLPQAEAVEVPFTIANAQGQTINGLVDHLVQTAEGPLIIDHKIFPGRQDQWESKALSYAGQLACYREAVGGNAKTFIHFASLGVLIEVGQASKAAPANPPDVQSTFDFG